MVQAHDFPLIVEHGRAGRAGFGIRDVVQVGRPFGKVEQFVFANDDFFPSALRMLNDVERFADDRFSFFHDQGKVSEFGERFSAVRFRSDRDEGEVESAVIQKESIRFETNGLNGDFPSFLVELIIELGKTPFRRLCIRKDVVVRD